MTSPTLSLSGANCLITGGMGFIGSNLAIELVKQGANVLICDAMLPDYGGNLFNIEPARDQVRINYCDIRSVHTMNYLVRGQDFIFHLAGQMDHVLSLTNPFPDIDINITGTTVLLEACKQHNPTARLIYTGTRGEYGKAVTLPVREDAPTRPRGIHEISRLAAEMIVRVYHEVHGIRAVRLRLTNTYGPRAQMKHSRYGVANWFVRQALDGETIKVFGTGEIKRDFLYVGDCVRALIMSAIDERAYGQVLNVGVPTPSNFRELAQTVVEVVGAGAWDFAPFTPERAAQEPGDFYSDISKIRATIGWEPQVSLVDGLRETVAYYRAHKAHYW